MSAEIRRSIVIGLGEEGYQVAEALQTRLRRRHNGIPIIQSMVLVESAQATNPATLNNFTLLPVTLDQKQIEEAKKESSISTWLPDIPQLSLEYRAGARLALLNMHDEIKQTLSYLIDGLLNSQTQRMMDERKLKISPIHAKTIDIFIVTNLADPLGSGMFIDLAYLVKKVILEKEADDLYFQVNGVFFLPPDSSQNDMQEVRWMQANSYAALKELNYYMNGQRYQLHYPRVGETLKFKEPPLEAGFCYLIGQTNEKIQTISSQDVIEMTAEWLCHITTAPVHARLAANFQIKHYDYGSEHAIGAYSSFGLSSLILPLPYIRDYCARRLAADLATSLLSKHSRAEEEERALRELQTREILPDGGVLERRLRGERDENDQQYLMSVASYQQFSVLQYQELEHTLIRHYDHRLGTILPEIKQRMLQNKNSLATEIPQKLKRYTTELFNDKPKSAIHSTISFFEEILKQVKERQRDLRRRIDFDARRNDQHEIKRARSEYFNAAQSFGHLPVLWPNLLTVTGLSVIAFMLWFGWSYYILARVLGYTNETYIIIAITALSLLAMLWTIRSRPASTKAVLIKKYDDRLKKRRKRDEAEQETEMMAQVEGWTYDLQQDIVKFRDEMIKVQAIAQKQWQEDHGHEAPWSQLLYGHPYFSLEKSVIDEADVEAYYKEVRGKSDQEYNRHFTRLFQAKYGGSYSTWLSSSATPQELWQRLYRYSSDWTEQTLKDHYIVAKIQERYETNAIREEIEQIKSYARPYLKIRLKGDLGEEADAPIKESIAVHFEAGEEDPVDGSNVANALYDLQLMQNIDDFGEKERLSVVTARRGLPLFILPDVMICSSSYRQVDRLSLVHTTRGNIALPDLSDRYNEQISTSDFALELDPRQALALAIAFSQYEKYPFSAVNYQTEASPAYTEAPIQPAGYYQLYTEQRQLEIAKRLNRTARLNLLYLGPTKSEACLTLYTNPDALAYLRQDLITYLHEANWTQLAGALADYIEQQQISELANLLNHIEDWEMVELEKALDVFLANLPSE